MLSFMRQKSIVTPRYRHFFNVLFLTVLTIGSWTRAMAQERAKPHMSGSWFVHKGVLPDDPGTRVGHFDAQPFESPGALSGYRGDLWFRMTVNGDGLPNGLDLAVDLGRIGDADRAYWNGRLIGATGMRGSGLFFLPHLHRVYLIGDDARAENMLVVHAVKTALDSLGIGLNPTVVRFDAASPLQLSARQDYALRTLLPLLLGVALLLFGAYHLFLYGFLRSFPDYRDFGACLICFGVFGVCVSFWPYELTMRPERVMYAHALGSIWALVFFGRYVLGQGRLGYRIFHRVHYALAASFSIAVLTATQLEAVMNRYLFWYALFIPGILGIFGVALFNRGNTRTRTVGLVVALALMIVALFHDVLVTLAVIGGDLWGIPVFLLILGVSILVIGRDFAHAYLAVEQTVTLRTQDLQRANEQLRGLEQMKSRFFANLSHDFKTPIALAFAHVGEVKRAAEASLQPALVAAEQALNRLHGMVLDLLDTMKAESGALRLTWETVSPCVIVRAWAAPYNILCQKKGLTLSFDFAVDEGMKIPIDVSKMERVFGNLMANALKFTDEGEITVGLRTDASQLYLSVCDTGPGIPAEEREKVFDRYFQGLSASLRYHGGSGIGLSFVKETIFAHNGRVWVEDVKPHGSSFVVALPLSQDVEITGEHRISELDIRVEAVKGSVEVPYPDSVPSEFRIDRPSVLVIEDNPEVAQVVVHTLEDLYNVYFAKDGLEGLEQLKARRIACIVSDLMMPRMDGRALLHEVKGNDRWKVIPFVCLTSMSDMEIMVECLKMGANNYVTKPFHREVLRSTVETLIQNTQYREQLVAKEKMASLGLLSAGLAHEMRNPIQAAQNLLEGLRRKFERWEKLNPSDSATLQQEMRGLMDGSGIIQESFRDVRNCVIRMNDMIDAIGNYSTGSGKIGGVDLVATVKHALRLLESKRNEKGVVIRLSGAQAVTVQAFSAIVQVITNVLDNAIDAVSEKAGRVEITVTETPDHAEIRVADNGSGIPLRDQSYIFEAFFTTKGPGAGTGLGLYVAKRIVDYHRGTIKLHSEPGHGATFTIQLKKIPDLESRERIDFKGFPVSF